MEASTSLGTKEEERNGALKTLLMSVLLLVSLATAASALNCDICNNKIESQYHVYQTPNGKLDVCVSCKAHATKCSTCALPLKTGQVRFVHNAAFCSSCAAKARFCNNCGSVINGKYYELKDLGELYCAQCYAHLPRCGRCKRPLSGPESQKVYMAENKRICSTCSNTAPRCSGCGNIIMRTTYKYKHSSEVFCFNCEHGTEKCYSCGLPSGKDGMELLDGRVICARCQQLAVVKREDFEKIWNWTRDYLTQRGFEVKSSIDVNIVNREELRKIVKGPAGAKEMGAFQRKGDKLSIHVLYGLPRPLLYETLAHEYAHAWQSENCPRDQDKLMIEGFAEWVASLALREKGFLLQLSKMDDRTDLYGQGYDKINKIALAQGMDRLLIFVCNNTRFP